MHNLVRFILIVGFSGGAMTLLAGLWAWWNEEDRRLRRIARRVLGGEPDAAIIARGRDSAAAFRLASAEVLVMRRGGASALLYPMRLLVGAELIIDGEVAARALRDEPRRVLDRIAGEARRVTLRLVFDDAANPDFDLDLWLAEDALRRDARPPAAAIQEARGWLARAEAILRRPAPTPQVAPIASPPAPMAVESECEPEPSPEQAPEPEWDGDPPWDEDSESAADPAAESIAPPPAEPPTTAKQPVRKSGDDGLPIPPLDEPIQPYLL
jgi:hypothetical protein